MSGEPGTPNTLPKAREPNARLNDAGATSRSACGGGARAAARGGLRGAATKRWANGAAARHSTIAKVRIERVRPKLWRSAVLEEG